MIKVNQSMSQSSHQQQQPLLLSYSSSSSSLTSWTLSPLSTHLQFYQCCVSSTTTTIRTTTTTTSTYFICPPTLLCPLHLRTCSTSATSPFDYSLLLHLLVPLLCPGHSSDVSSVHQLLFKTTTTISISNRMKWIHEWFLSESRPIDPSIQWSSPSWPTAVPVRATNHRRQNITEDRKRKKIREYIYLLWYILTDDPKHDTWAWPNFISERHSVKKCHNPYDTYTNEMPVSCLFQLP